MKTLVVVLTILFLTGCNYHISKAPKPGTNDSMFGKVEDDELIFSFVKENILRPKCYQCHSAAGPKKSLETYEEVIANLADIIQDIEIDRMPPKKKGPLTAEEKELFFRWVALGTPQ